jgi:hypothetical protein
MLHAGLLPHRSTSEIQLLWRREKKSRMLAELSGSLQRISPLHEKSKRKRRGDERRQPRKGKNRLGMREKLSKHM